MQRILFTAIGIVLIIMTIRPYSLSAQDFARGADVGWLSEMEQSGRVWRDSMGVQRDLFDILDDYCINSIRLRVWVNPENGWSGKQDVIQLAKRAVAKGYRLMIDFHYSDSWADPGQQTKPSAWRNYTVNQLKDAVYNHTHEVLTALKNENITPEWVQVGNETNNGMLWPEGQASTNMANYAAFVLQGYNAVKAVFPSAKVIVHVSNGHDNSLFQWNIGKLIKYDAKFDVIAMSMYPDQASEWETYAQQAYNNMQNMIQLYNKEIMVSEIGMPTNEPVRARQFVERVIQNLQDLPQSKGLGIFWWEPQAYNWKGYGKVAWNGSSGSQAYQATEAMKGFMYNCNVSNTEPPPTPKHVTVTIRATGFPSGNGYITGTMTENQGDWRIVPMELVAPNVFETSFTLLENSTGAMYLLQENNWQSRETVPSACVQWYDGDRGYAVGSNDTTIYITWNSCSNEVDCKGTFGGNYIVDNCGLCVLPHEACAEFTYSLTAGWNLISTHLLPLSGACDNAWCVESFFTNNAITMVKDMNGFWLRSQTNSLQSLSTIQPHKGYLVYVESAVNFTAQGVIAPQTAQTYPQGWNLIGYPGCNQANNCDNYSISDLFNATNCQHIKNFDGFWMPNGTQNSIQNFEIGKGYYVWSQ